MSNMPEVIEKINALTKISHERDLTETELKQRQELRARYIELFRANFRQELDNTFIEDADGNKVPLKDWHNKVAEDAKETFNK